MGQTGRVGKTVMGAALALAAGLCMAAEQRPDFTGVWTNAGGPGIGGATSTNASVAELVKPEAKARIDAYQKLVAKSGDSPGGWCLGTGMPGSMLGSGGYPMEIIQRPEQITIVYEAHTEMRRVYFGGRNAPEADRVPGRNGYSSGRWEGDTLVVETDNLVDQVDQRTTSHSDQATIVERYSFDGKDAAGPPHPDGRDDDDRSGFLHGAREARRSAGRKCPMAGCCPTNARKKCGATASRKLAREAGVPVP